MSIYKGNNLIAGGLPNQTGQSGKFLTTDGSEANWDSITVPTKISDLTDDTSTNPIDKADTLTNLTATVSELNVLDGITATTTELNYTDGVTSNIQTQLNGKQANLTAGTNITIENNVISASGGTYTAGNGLKLDNGEFSIVQVGGSLWTQPVLTSAGTMGVSEMAATQSGYFASDTLGWKLFDGYAVNEQDHRWQVNNVDVSYYQWVEWYTATAVRITSLAVTNAGGELSAGDYILQGSNDGSQWTILATGTNTNTTDLGVWTISCSNNTNYYNYYKLQCKPISSIAIMLAEIDITGYTNTSSGSVAKATNSLYGLVKPDGTTITVSDGVISASPATSIDDTTITKNSNDELQAVKLVGLTSSITQLNYSSNVTSDIQTQLNGKQATISDLSTIRSGAGLGATALQPNDNISELTNDSGYITSSGSITGSSGSCTGNSATATTLQNLTATVSELNYVDGVTSNIQTQLDSKSTYHPDILTFQWSDHILNDIQWLRADTFSWQSGDVYVTAYNKLVEEYATGSEETEGSITFKRTVNGFKIATSDYEDAVLSKYDTYGIAWYYILDTENKRFKLPRTKFGFEGLRDNVGDDIAESLPNIEGAFDIGGTQRTGVDGAEGAFYTFNHGSGQNYTGSFSQTAYSCGFDASRSSSTYQDNAPVQERATQMYLYFYVGEYTQTAIEQTAGLNSELFNGKLDVTSAQAQAPYLKTTYINGTSGYNIWSNGYCEQWGVPAGNTTTYLKTFANTNYTLLLSAGYPNSYGFAHQDYPYSKTTTSFTLTYVADYLATNYSWKASGYLAEGQY